ncbi:ornithine cyclodeaminase family protein [Nannocystis bainbridge]|uniref:Ornithine cyclodeaminase family protein n=1 Tax=Nannocystis bainbridge TaxID=2995303 RepID=A0ABT5DX54_9BACT|nr:ornithine cyclodeaminase family protein [Nannocystis bainbridge]MDC0718125.1 ornithine cyclodeaminase family protein [Nannocystis bainbridge]
MILTQREIRQLLPMAECIEQMAEVLTALARDEATSPLRWGMRLAGGAILGMMPAALQSRQALGLKIVAVFPSNHGTPFDSHQGLVTLFDADTGAPRAILDATEVTAIRTAAVSAVATRALAREGADELAILGAGTQAWTHLEAMQCVRPIRRVRVFSATPANREAFARQARQRFPLEVRAVGSAREAVDGAAIVCTTTSSREPVLYGEWLAPGTHVNAVGACVPAARELDARAVARARLYVDRCESALAESGDFLLARAEGIIDDGHILGELGELLCGACEGRRSDADITLFKSLGLGVEDVAVAHYLHGRALATGVGVQVDLGGRRRLGD